jgi:DNA polymerase I
MDKKIVLIDGHSILNRAFYGVPPLTNAAGLHTNAVYGFLNIMFKIMEEEKAGYLAVAFDIHAPTFRHEIYSEYKGTRKGMPDELREQVPVIKEVLKSMGICTLEKSGYEADDILGTLGKRMEKEGFIVSIVSGDRDLLQLATEKIKIRIPKTKSTGTEVENYNEKEVFEKYQVTPLQFIDLKALMGDASDNIPGIPGVGEKTAMKIISAYGSIETAYEHVEDIKPNKAKESLQNHYDKAQLSKVLATINIDTPVEFQIEEAKIENFYTKEAYEVFQRLEFKNLLGRFDSGLSKNKVEEDFQNIKAWAEVKKLFAKVAGKKEIGFFILEEAGELLGISFAFGEQEIYSIFIENDITKENLLIELNSLVNTVTKVSVFDWKHTLKFVEPSNKDAAFDVSIAAYLVNPLKNDYSYEDVANEYLNSTVPSRTELIGKLTNKKAFSEQRTDLEKLMGYHAYVAYHVIQPLTKKLIELQMLDLYNNIDKPLLFTLFDMEKEGILIEPEELKIYGAELGEKIVVLEKTIHESAGEEFNINSPKQLGVILFEKLQLPNGKKTKTGYSTAADVLEKLAGEYPIVSSILEYRQLTKLKSTYADGLATYIDAGNRIHSSFNQTITATGRISSTEPNLQNIPIRMELGRLIRKVFIPKEGCIFVDADYSQIELRLLAHMSGDEHLIQAYKEAKDIHRMTASQVFNIPFDEVTNLQRSNAKAVNFGIVYGISSFSLSEDLSITKKEADKYIKEYFETYPSVKAFLEGSVEQAKNNGYVETLYGRKRPVPELKSSNFMQRAFGERIAMNSPIQGTAADIMKVAMIGVHKALQEQKLKSKLILQVHDELLIEAYVDEVDKIKDILEVEMKKAFTLSVPLEIDVHTGVNWYEAK